MSQANANQAADIASRAIATAAKHLNNGAVMASSAASCIEDARRIMARGDYALATRWAVRSMSYSVGIFHPDYQAWA